MYRVFRYKKYPLNWPTTSTVYVDVSPGTVEEYVTDSNGTPKLVGNYIGMTTYADSSEFPTVGKVDRLYIDGSTVPNAMYRWNGTTYVAVGASGGGSSIPGGTTGQILSKNSNTDYDFLWIDNFAEWTSRIKEYVKAGEAISKGQAVYVSSANGTNPIISKASNATEATSSKTIGLCAQTLANNGFGYVVTEGLLDGLNTGTAANGDPVWLGTGGNLLYGLVAKPNAPNHLVYIGVVLRAHSINGVIYVKVQNGFELGELHDVDLKTTVPISLNVLYYNGTVWKPANIEDVLGYSPYPESNPYSYQTSSQVSTAISTALTGYATESWVTLQGYLTSSSLSGYATQSWVTSQGYITNVVTALGYTPENVANKENTALDTSTTKYPSNNVVKAAVDAKVTVNSPITGATKTKVTYDAKGLVTGGADATTADIADSTNKRYVTDSQLTDIGTIGSKAAKTQVDYIGGIIQTPANQDYTLVLRMPIGGTIIETSTQCTSGTCTATFKVNSTALTANSVSSTLDTKTQSQSFVAGDTIVVTVSSNSSCSNLNFNIKYNVTLS